MARIHARLFRYLNPLIGGASLNPLGPRSAPVEWDGGIFYAHSLSETTLRFSDLEPQSGRARPELRPDAPSESTCHLESCGSRSVPTWPLTSHAKVRPPIRWFPWFQNASRAIQVLAERENWSRSRIEAFQLERLNQIRQHATAHVAVLPSLRLQPDGKHK